MAFEESAEAVSWYQYPSRMIRRMYQWVMHWADTPYAIPALFLLAVAESSFFPIPPDVLMIALAFSAPLRSFYFALVCAAGSVLGGVIGYGIGYFFWGVAGPFFLTYVFSEQLFAVVQNKYAMHSFWIVFTAAFTPIPYKIFTVAAGVFQINFLGFFLASLVGRSMRFFLVAAMLFFFGQKAKKYVEKYFDWFAIIFTVLLILGFICVERIL